MHCISISVQISILNLNLNNNMTLILNRNKIHSHRLTQNYIPPYNYRDLILAPSIDFIFGSIVENPKFPDFIWNRMENGTR